MWVTGVIFLCVQDFSVMSVYVALLIFFRGVLN